MTAQRDSAGEVLASHSNDDGFRRKGLLAEILSGDLNLADLGPISEHIDMAGDRVNEAENIVIPQLHECLAHLSGGAMAIAVHSVLQTGSPAHRLWRQAGHEKAAPQQPTPAFYAPGQAA